ncbi:hypothetical protein E4U23_000929 [Claviceps purpurea]|nr:hypothetical protein E4U23_000929 [Claviceps purpurea]
MTKTEVFVQDPYRAQTGAPPYRVQVMTSIHPPIKAQFFPTEIYRGSVFAIANVHQDDGTIITTHDHVAYNLYDLDVLVVTMIRVCDCFDQ